MLLTHEVQQPKELSLIVVLPFASLGGTDDLIPANRRHDATDYLTNILSHIPSFRVISRQTALSYKRHAIDVGMLGSELLVRYVLEGTVRLQAAS